MSKKKIGRAIAAGLAAYGASKMLGASNKAKLAAAQTDTADFGSQMENDTVLAQGTRKNYEAGIATQKAKEANSLLGRTKKFLREEVFTTNPKTKLRDVLPSFKGSPSSEMYGLESVGGAKKGGMMKAAKGTYVTAKCKMGRNKKTRIV